MGGAVSRLIVFLNRSSCLQNRPPQRRLGIPNGLSSRHLPEYLRSRPSGPSERGGSADVLHAKTKRHPKSCPPSNSAIPYFGDPVWGSVYDDGGRQGRAHVEVGRGER